MGLDLAGANSGLCVVKAHYPKYSYEVLHEEAFHHPMVDFRNRAAASSAILKLAEKYKPDVIAIEDYARRFGKTNTSGYEHAEVGGMTKKALHEAGFLIYIIPPTSMRSFMDAPPKSPKEILVELAASRQGFTSSAKTKKDRGNITDAFIHAHIGSLLYIVKNFTLEYNLTPAEDRIINGTAKFEGLKDRSNVEYG